MQIHDVGDDDDDKVIYIEGTRGQVWWPILEMCSLHLTHPSAHTLGSVGSRHCGARGAVGGSMPCSRVSPQSWTIPAGAEIRTHNLGLQVRRSIH